MIRISSGATWYFAASALKHKRALAYWYQVIVIIYVSAFPDLLSTEDEQILNDRICILVLRICLQPPALPRWLANKAHASDQPASYNLRGFWTLGV